MGSKDEKMSRTKLEDILEKEKKESQNIKGTLLSVYRLGITNAFADIQMEIAKFNSRFELYEDQIHTAILSELIDIGAINKLPQNYNTSNFNIRKYMLDTKIPENTYQRTKQIIRDIIYEKINLNMPEELITR